MTTGIFLKEIWNNGHPEKNILSVEIFIFLRAILIAVFSNSYRDRHRPRSLFQKIKKNFFNNIIVLIPKYQKSAGFFKILNSFQVTALHNIVFIAAFNNNIHY